MSDPLLAVLAVPASSRRRSASRAAAMLVVEAARDHGADVRIWDLRDRPLPPYDAETGESALVDRARDLVRWSDAIVLSTPDFHGGPSGRLKDFLDHFWRELTGKLFATVVASAEKGLTVHDQLRTTIRQVYGWSLPYGLSADAAAVGDDGRLRDPRVADRARMMARDLAVYGALLRRQRLADLAAGGTTAEIGFVSRLLGHEQQLGASPHPPEI